MTTAAAVAMQAHGFDDSQHPRGQHGRFATAGGHAERHAQNVSVLARQGVLPRLQRYRDGTVIEHAGPTSKVISYPTPRAADATQAPTNQVIPLDERRTRATMPSYYRRIASNTPGMPTSYTGSDKKEAPVGSFLVHQLTDQRPKAVSPRDHAALRARLGRLVTTLAEPTIAMGKVPKRRGKLRGETLIPEGTPELTARRAYTHAAMTALHNYGVAKYDFAMDPALKEEMTPLKGFMLYAKRRVMDTMFAAEKGRYAPYRQEFGEPFADKRRDKVSGQVRIRMSPRTEMIKAEPVGSLAKAYASDKHPREHDGKFSRKTGEAVGRLIGGFGGTAVGGLIGHRHGAAIGAGVGGALARLHGRITGIMSSGPAHHHAFTAELGEMKGILTGAHIGGRYGGAIGGLALGAAGWATGAAVGRHLDDSGRKNRAIVAGKPGA